MKSLVYELLYLYTSIYFYFLKFKGLLDINIKIYSDSLLD